MYVLLIREQTRRYGVRVRMSTPHGSIEMAFKDGTVERPTAMHTWRSLYIVRACVHMLLKKLSMPAIDDKPKPGRRAFAFCLCLLYRIQAERLSAIARAPRQHCAAAVRACVRAMCISAGACE